MARRFRVANNKAAIWTGETDTAPFDNPIGNLSRVKFHSDLNYVNVIDENTFNVTFPARSKFQSASQIYPLYQHGRGGYPFILGSMLVNGVPCAITGSVPVQIGRANNGGLHHAAFARWVSIGADSVWVYAFEYTVAYFSNSNFYGIYDQITVPITILMTNEIL